MPQWLIEYAAANSEGKQDYAVSDYNISDKGERSGVQSNAASRQSVQSTALFRESLSTASFSLVLAGGQQFFGLVGIEHAFVGENFLDDGLAVHQLQGQIHDLRAKQRIAFSQPSIMSWKPPRVPSMETILSSPGLMPAALMASTAPMAMSSLWKNTP